jgi:hypothetical protein
MGLLSWVGRSHRELIPPYPTLLFCVMLIHVCTQICIITLHARGEAAHRQVVAGDHR